MSGSYYAPGFAYGTGGMTPYYGGYAMPSYGTTPYQSGYYTPGEIAPETLGGSNDGTVPARPLNSEAPATIVVQLPADARLTIDGEATQSRSDTRTFVSPPLTPGKTYRYVLKAQVDRNGQTAETSRNVEVQAGKQTTVELEFPERAPDKR
jgi:uncharacterized protein (TIGR03000 family)